MKYPGPIHLGIASHPSSSAICAVRMAPDTKRKWLPVMWPATVTQLIGDKNSGEWHGSLQKKAGVLGYKRNIFMLLGSTPSGSTALLSGCKTTIVYRTLQGYQFHGLSLMFNKNNESINIATTRGMNGPQIIVFSGTFSPFQRCSYTVRSNG